MTGPIIRDARGEDREGIRALTLAAYQEYAAHAPALWEHYRENIEATLADVRPAAQVVAERAGTLLGAVLLYPSGSTAEYPGQAPAPRRWPEVRLLAVAPAERGAGVAAALMAECIRRCRAAGDGALTLHTMAMMQSARRLYDRLGFVADPALDFHPAPRLTVEGYRLDLASPSRPGAPPSG